MAANNNKREEESELDGLRKRPSLTQVAAELKQLGSIALPVTAMNCVVFLRAMVSVLCLGRLGSLPLAGGALSLGFTNITGYSVLFGLASGMDPVCSQAFGSQNWPLLGLSLQRTILILLSACLPIGILWLNFGSIMLHLGQDATITAVASTYCLYSLPDLAVNSLLQPLRVFMRSQGYTTPMMLCSFLAVAIHIPLNIVLVFVFKLGVPGVAFSTVLTNLNMVLFMVAYIWAWGACGKTWTGWSADCFTHWRPLLSLALPSCFGICLEWWWYEILVVVAGYLPKPQVAISTAAILMQTTSLMYTFPLALSASASTRVGNELGANVPSRAQLAAHVALACALLVAVISATLVSLLRGYWARLFSDDPGIVELTAAALPIIGLCELGNCPQTTGCGILRGSARPTIGAHINLGSFYFVGTPVALVLAFRTKLGFTGLWFGLLAAQAVCAVAILAVILRTDWRFEASRAKQLTAPPPNGTLEMATLNGTLEMATLGDEESDEESSLLLSNNNSSI